jgi:predicted AAA+ superfamily ATPase
MNVHDRIVEQNIHWQRMPFSVPTGKRDMYKSLQASLDSPLMTFLYGARRTGKSILLKQLVNHLVTNTGVPPSQILFFEFLPKDERDSIGAVYRYFTQNKALNSGKTYLFFDEIQVVAGFEIALKELYDRLDQTNTKIVITGSPSISYKRTMAESLAGRYIPYRLFPLNFREYLRLSASPVSLSLGHDHLIRMGALERLNREFKRFLTCGRLPQMLSMSEMEQSYYLDATIDASITRDAFDYFTIQNPGALSGLYTYICQNNGQIATKESLAHASGVSRITIAKYLDVLELMGLVYIIYNSTNPFIRLNSARKIYVSSMQGIKHSRHDPQTAFGFATESYILERLLERNELVTFYRNRTREIDFLLPKKKIAYEVKYRPSAGHPKAILPDYQLTVVSYQGSTPACLF